MLRRLWEWWELRRLERDRAFLLRQDRDDPRVRTLLPLVERRIEQIRMEQAMRLVKRL